MTASRKNEVPSIHYIWVGPPSPSANKDTAFGHEVSGHDVSGPLAMAQANNANPIVFWCLDKHVGAYQKKFQGQNIQVKSIESHIAQQKKSNNEHVKQAANKMEQILIESLRVDKEATDMTLPESDKGGDKVPVRDRVTVKDAFNLFLHATTDEPMYTLDTNVKPTSKPIKLPHLDKFIIPYLKGDYENVKDVWTMYSPKSGKNVAAATFMQYHQIWNTRARIEFQNRKYSSQYEQILGSAIVNTLQDNMHGQGEVIKATQTEDGSYHIGELGISKTYYNTHKADVFMRAIMTIKEYIATHRWQTETYDLKLFTYVSGETITLDNGNQKKVPASIAKQWNMIREWEKNPANTPANEVLYEIIKVSLQGKSSKGERSDDTQKYLNLCADYAGVQPDADSATDFRNDLQKRINRDKQQVVSPAASPQVRRGDQPDSPNMNVSPGKSTRRGQY